MSKQIDFLKRCIALNLQSGGLLDLLDRIEELERDLLNLVCRIHRDGGHYIAKYGEAKAIADADTVAAQNNADLDALQADNAELVAALERMRVAGGSQEFHIAWELAKDVLDKVRKP